MTFRKVKCETDIEATFTCKICSKAFPTKPSLNQHVRRNHKGTQFQCYYCSFDTKFRECLVRHVPLHLVKKDFGVGKRGAYVKCPLCEFGCVVRETMIDHYVKEHDVDMGEQHFGFQNMEEFLNWKYEIEQTDVCQFTSRSKKNRGALQIRYYRCFRDGIFQKKGRGIRNMKLKGSLRINGVCPAGIKAEEDMTSGVIRVTCIRSHVGHSNDLGLMNLSKSERAEIACKLSMGLTREDIIGSIHGSMDAEIKRLHLTTFKDVWNVQCSYGLRTEKAKRVKGSKTTKAREKVSKNYHSQIMPGNLPGSNPPIAETSPDVGNVPNICVPKYTENVIKQTHQENSTSIKATRTGIWSIPRQTELQEPESFHTAQTVPHKNNVTQSSLDLDNANNMPFIQHEHAVIELCDSSCDNDDHYYEVITQDLPDSGLIPMETHLCEKKNKIKLKLDELLEAIKTEEEADALYNKLLHIQDTTAAHSSVEGPF